MTEKKDEKGDAVEEGRPKEGTDSMIHRFEVGAANEVGREVGLLEAAEFVGSGVEAVGSGVGFGELEEGEGGYWAVGFRFEG